MVENQHDDDVMCFFVFFGCFLFWELGFVECDGTVDGSEIRRTPPGMYKTLDMMG